MACPRVVCSLLFEQPSADVRGCGVRLQEGRVGAVVAAGTVATTGKGSSAKKPRSRWFKAHHRTEPGSLFLLLQAWLKVPCVSFLGHSACGSGLLSCLPSRGFPHNSQASFEKHNPLSPPGSNSHIAFHLPSSPDALELCSTRRHAITRSLIRHALRP